MEGVKNRLLSRQILNSGRNIHVSTRGKGYRRAIYIFLHQLVIVPLELKLQKRAENFVFQSSALEVFTDLAQS